MDALEATRLMAAESDLKKAIEKAEAELIRLNSRKDALKKDIEHLKKSVGRIESKGQKIVAFGEYRRMRLEVVQFYKDLATCESNIRQQSKNLSRLKKDLQLTQDSLGMARRPRPVN